MQVLSRPLFITFIVIVLLTTACQGPPPTEYVIITPTPDGTLTPTLTLTPVIVVVTATPEPITPTSPSQSATPTEEPTQEVTVEVDSLMPTITIAQIQVAEQVFQNGRMYWLQPIDQLWVMANSSDDKQGIWMVYEDEFEEGDLEFDPKIVAPEGLLQPERGFGKLWRDNPEIREALGWGVQPELGFVSNYRYEPGGEVENEQFSPGFGYHILNSSEGDVFRFNEINGTWQLLRAARRQQ